MELAEDKVKSLIDGENLNKLNDETLDQVIRIAVSHLCRKSDGEALTQLCRSKPDVIKTAYADVIKLLIEAARHDTSSEELSKLLGCTALTKAHIDKFCQFHANYKEQLQENLETIGNGLPHIIDVDWRIDYCIKSSINDSAGIPNYNISLSTMKHGNIQSVRFMCTIQELQELVLKLKDAARHIEKLTNP